MEPSFFIFPTLAFACVVLNICSLVILYRTSCLRTRRFNCLVLYLSISNTLIGLQALGSAVNYIFVAVGDIAALYSCGVFGILLRATTLFSLYQVLLICIERLNATFTPSKRALTVLTTDRSVLVGFVLIHCYPVTIWVYDILHDQPRCEVVPTLRLFLSLDLPIVMTMSAFGLIYFIAIRRLMLHLRSQKHTEITERKKIKMEKMKRNVVTLGLIVALNISIVLPRFFAVVTTLSSEPTEDMSRILLICTNLLILNPLLDPVIYLFRIRTFRHRLFCCHGDIRVHDNRVGHNEIEAPNENRQQLDTSSNNVRVVFVSAAVGVSTT